MDYTLVHYRVDEWERRAHSRVKELLIADGWPVAHLEFDPQLVIRGLIIDTELGNIVKANRFGYVMRAFHGTRSMTFEEQRETYRHSPVDLADSRGSLEAMEADFQTINEQTQRLLNAVLVVGVTIGVSRQGRILSHIGFSVLISEFSSCALMAGS